MDELKKWWDSLPDDDPRIRQAAGKPPYEKTPEEKLEDVVKRAGELAAQPLNFEQPQVPFDLSQHLPSLRRWPRADRVTTSRIRYALVAIVLMVMLALLLWHLAPR
jgi:hypothetical protein